MIKKPVPPVASSEFEATLPPIPRPVTAASTMVEYSVVVALNPAPKKLLPFPEAVNPVSPRCIASSGNLHYCYCCLHYSPYPRSVQRLHPNHLTPVTPPVEALLGDVWLKLPLPPAPTVQATVPPAVTLPVAL